MASLDAQQSRDADDHDLPPLQKEAFDFSLVQRNSLLVQRGLKAPGFMKTGTTIAGVIFKDGVVLGADTRATEGSIVADKNCAKIHHISSKIWYDAQHSHRTDLHCPALPPPALLLSSPASLLVPLCLSGAAVRAPPPTLRT